MPIGESGIGICQHVEKEAMSIQADILATLTNTPQNPRQVWKQMPQHSRWQVRKALLEMAHTGQIMMYEKRTFNELYLTFSKIDEGLGE